jgi:hypothetical protein
MSELKSRCGLCNIQINPKDFKAHSETLSHKLNLNAMLGYWVELNTLYKDNSDKAFNIIQSIKYNNPNKIKVMGEE